MRGVRGIVRPYANRSKTPGYAEIYRMSIDVLRTTQDAAVAVRRVVRDAR